MRRMTSVVIWGVTSALGLVMIGRGIWALHQPWRSTGDKLFALAFFAGLTGFAAYKLLLALRPAASRLASPFNQNVAYGVVSLVGVLGGIFVYLRGGGSTSEISTVVAGALFLGAGAILFFIRARRP